MKDQLTQWLKSEQDNIDQAICNASIAYYDDHKLDSNFSYDLKECHLESYNLIKGQDLCYDRPNTAFAYSLWYHPRRINTFLTFFLDKLLESQGSHIEIFDLGAGTGAIQWGLGLIYAGIKRIGLTPPKITVINIDTSPFMLCYNRDYLWKSFLNFYPEIDSDFILEFEVNSWSNGHKLDMSNPILAASYLFDASDKKTEIAENFKSLVDKYKPSSILLLTSAQPEKVKFLKELEGEFEDNGYGSQRIPKSSLLFNQSLTKINEMRKYLGETYDVSALLRGTYWNDNSHAGLILNKTQISLSLDSQLINSLGIYNKPITRRNDVTLNEYQAKSALVTQNPAVIVGSAGCGKSIVITEKIKNIVELHNYSTNLEILVTTFNKGLIGKLAEWIICLLDSSKYTIFYDTNYYGYNDKSCSFTFTNSTKVNIRLIHFDMLPKYLGEVWYRGMYIKQNHLNLLSQIIDEVKIENSVSAGQFESILEPDFLLEEYHKVIYGMQVNILNGHNAYLNITRKGRGNPSLQKNSLIRELIWQCLSKYYAKTNEKNWQSFTLRRQKLYQKLKSEEIGLNYDYILVDEFQDCTEADFEIFYSMIKNPNNLTIAGDLAQSIHLGTTARIPRDSRMNRRQFYRLDGSYRLPVRISECIKALSLAIVEKFSNDEGASGISPYKGAPPGARPIVVYGEDYIQLANKVVQAFKKYSIFDLNRITILEKDEELKSQLIKGDLIVETDTILGLKGLEKECVLWTTRMPFDFENEVLEFTYTILTRTSCLLIIGITNNTQDVYRKILGLLRKERLIMWDKETENKFDSLCENYEPEEIIVDD